MPKNYDIIDFAYDWNGDFQIGTDGDLGDTSADGIKSLVQEIQTIANSSLGDWEEHPRYAASLDDYIGEPNDRDTANRITERLRSSLVNAGVCSGEDVAIRVVPVEQSRVLVIVQVSAAATKNNSIMDNGLPTVFFVYDYFERGITFVNKP
jgi:phage baseplate assembly protein W